MNDLTPVAQLPLAPEPVSASTTVLQVIANAASNPAVDVDKMKQLFELHERMDLRVREKEFDSAMAAVQAEIRGVAKDATNPQTHSKYASDFALDAAVRPACAKYGLSMSYDTDSSHPDQSALLILCRVSHTGGFSRSYSLLLPADGKGAKGGDVMTKTHATGSALTYGMRYLRRMIFNISVGGKEDDDGNAASKQPEARPATVTGNQKFAAEAAAQAGTGALRMFYTQNPHLKDQIDWGELANIATKVDAARLKKEAADVEGKET